MCAWFLKCIAVSWLILGQARCHYLGSYEMGDEYDENRSSEEEIAPPIPIPAMHCYITEHVIEDDDYAMGDYHGRRNKRVNTCTSASDINLLRNYDELMSPSRSYGGDSFSELVFASSHITKISNGIFDTARTQNLDINKLSISNVDLQGLETNALYKLMNLRHLDLSKNKIETIQPGSLNGLQSLRHLNISRNMLKGILDKRNFTGLGSSLTHLDLSLNNILHLRKNALMDFPNLVMLNVSHNAMTVLASSLFQYNEQLMDINFSHNNISEIGNNTFLIMHMNNLDISFNNISELSDTSFTRRTFGKCDINVLKIDHNSLENIDFILETFEIHNAFVGDNKIYEIPNGRFCGDLQLSQMHLEKLTNISMCNTGVIFVASYNALKEIPSWSEMQAVQIVELQHNNISTIPLGRFHDFRSLQILRLDKNFITKLDIGVFSGLNNLISLNISFNKLSFIDHHVTYGLKQLRELYLGGNSLTTLAAKDMFNGLKSLKTLGLNNNHWNCIKLMEILQEMDVRDIDIVHHGYVDYRITNLGGVQCWDNQNVSSSETKNDTNISTMRVNTSTTISVIEKVTLGITLSPSIKKDFSSKLDPSTLSLSTISPSTFSPSTISLSTLRPSTIISTHFSPSTNNSPLNSSTQNSHLPSIIPNITSEAVDTVHKTFNEVTTTDINLTGAIMISDINEQKLLKAHLLSNDVSGKESDAKLQAIQSGIYEMKNIFVIVIILLCCMICMKLYKVYRNTFKSHKISVVPSVSRQSIANEMEM